MKKITFVGLLSFLMLSGLALAEQTGQEKKASPMQGMMQEMMKGEKTGEGGMGGMMRMMKMMEQCGAMMESMHTESGEAKEGQKK
jgi:hypothetical protein